MNVDGSIAPARPVWWRRWLVQPVVNQLTRGIAPEKLAWTIALAVVLGIFPIMGSTTLVCFLAGWALRLNQPILHSFSSLVFPLHLGLILVFIRLGQKLYGVAPIPFAIPELLARFHADPLQFARDFGMAAWHGVSAWLLVAPPLALAIKAATLPLLRRAAARFAKEVPA
jgi:hypothetical protein